MASPYVCVRCGYETPKKNNMIKHFDRKNLCNAVNNVELTQEVKTNILENRLTTKNLIGDSSIIQKQQSELSKLLKNEYFNYIYLVRPEENVLNNNNIYKIGKSVLKEKTCNISRLSGYRQGSELIIVCQCIDANKMEKEIIKKFHNEFKLAYGNEYFIGDKYTMITIINEVLKKEEKNTDNIKNQKMNTDISFEDPDILDEDRMDIDDF